MVANNADAPPFVTIISSTTHSIVPNGKITFDGTTTVHGTTPVASNGIEQCQWSPRTGKFYISIPGIDGGINGGGGVAVINPKTTPSKVETTFLIDGNDCFAPQGMAIGPDKQILLGCNGESGDGNHSTVIINEDSGAIIATLHNESGSDEVWFNEGDGHYFLARSSATGASQFLGIVDASQLSEDQSIFTSTKTIAGRNAHSVAADSKRNQVYVPIPAGNSTVCSSVSVPGHKGDDAQGCIAVFTTHNNDRPSAAQERQADEHQE
jgi:hypothetical protein